MSPDDSSSFTLASEFHRVFEEICRYKGRPTLAMAGASRRITMTTAHANPPLYGLFQISSVTYGGRCREVTCENLATDSISTAALRRMGLTSVAWPVVCARQSVMVTDRGTVRGPVSARVCASAGEGGFLDEFAHRVIVNPRAIVCSLVWQAGGASDLSVLGQGHDQ